MKLTLIEWEDISSEVGWCNLKQVIEGRIEYLVHTCGILLYEDDKVVILSHSFVEEDESLLDPITIPKRCINYRRDISGEWEEFISEENKYHPKVEMKKPLPSYEKPSIETIPIRVERKEVYDRT